MENPPKVCVALHNLHMFWHFIFTTPTGNMFIYMGRTSNIAILPWHHKEACGLLADSWRGHLGPFPGFQPGLVISPYQLPLSALEQILLLPSKNIIAFMNTSTWTRVSTNLLDSLKQVYLDLTSKLRNGPAHIKGHTQLMAIMLDKAEAELFHQNTNLALSAVNDQCSSITGGSCYLNRFGTEKLCSTLNSDHISIGSTKESIQYWYKPEKWKRKIVKINVFHIFLKT